MNNLKTFIFKEYTKDSYQVIGAGIYPCNTKNDIIYLISSLKKFQIKPIDDPFYVDYALSSYITKNCPKSINALGVSIYIPSIKSQTGGIIGNPHSRGTSADGLSEYLGNGLSVAAYPGGPGIIICGTTKEAEMTLKTVKPEDGGKKSLSIMLNKAKSLGIKMAVLISDGSGTKSQGCVMTLENNAVRCISIDRQVANDGRSNDKGWVEFNI